MTQPPPTGQIPAGWYPDPAPTAPGRPPQLRWWDGSTWTDHLRPAEQPAAPEPQPVIPGSEYGGRAGFGSAPQPPPEQAPQQQAAQGGGFVNEVGRAPQQGGHQQGGYQQGQQGGYQQGGYQQGPPPGLGRSPYTESRMAVSQKRKLIELTNEYDILGTDGVLIGRVVEVGQSGLKKAARFLTSLDQYMTHTLEVRDAAGNLVFTLTRPAKVIKSSVILTHPNGAEMGRLVQQNVFGKIRFAMEAQGRQVGLLSAENWIAWNFRMEDHNGTQVGRITKTFEGFLTTMFTTADKYAVDIDPNVQEPLKSLCLAAALTVDTALKQDSRGFG